MPACILDENHRNEAIQRFERILDRQNLKFINEISVAPVSMIGVPNPLTLMRNAWVSGGKWLGVIRVMALALAGIITIIDLGTYLYIALSLITSSLSFIWLDSVVIWIQNRNPENRIAWALGSIILSAFMALGIGWPIGIFTTIAMAFEPTPTPTFSFYLLAILADISMSFFGAFGVYWFFMTMTNSDRILFEERFVAVRKCLQSREQSARLSNQCDARGYARSMELRLAVVKSILLWAIPLIVYIARPVFIPLQMDDSLSLVAILALAGLIVLGGILASTGKKRGMLLRTALTTMIVSTLVASLLVAFSNLEALVLGFCYVLGVALLTALIKSYDGVLNEKPEILGQRYFEYYLASLERDEAERFIEETIERLDAMISPV